MMLFERGEDRGITLSTPTKKRTHTKALVSLYAVDDGRNTSKLCRACFLISVKKGNLPALVEIAAVGGLETRSSSAGLK